MVALSSWYPYVLPQVPGASDLIVDQCLRQAAIDFCNRSDLIQRVIAADVTAATQDYTITAPAEMIFTRLLGVSWQGNALAPVSPDLVTSAVALRGANVGTALVERGDPQMYFQKLPNDSGFSLYPIPDRTITLGLTVKAAFAPTNAALTLEDVLFNDWVETIAAGALMRLTAMPGQPFTSPAAAGYTKIFERGLWEAKRLKNAGALPGSLRVRPRAFS